MIQKFSYSFDDLEIDPAQFPKLLGYPDGDMPELFSHYMEEALQQAVDLCDIHGAIYVSSRIRFSENLDRLTVADTELAIGKTVGKELRHSEAVVLFISTAGEKISEIARQLLKGDNPAMGYVYDVVGSVAADAVAGLIHREISKVVKPGGQQVTNRYSPGYCQWDVADQSSLFSFFPEKCCGISLSSSSLMSPVKSVSGLFGIGKNVKYREYTCDICGMENCFYRVHQK